MSSGAPFQHGNVISAAKLNRKTVTPTSSLSGEVMLPGQIFMNLANNGGFLKNSVVARNADNDGFVFLTQGRHYHDSDTEEAGGLFTEVFSRNITKAVIYNKQIGLSVGDFFQEGSGGSTAFSGTIGAIVMATGTTPNNWRGQRLMGVRPFFGGYMLAQTKMQFTGNTTNQFARWGINMEPMDTTNDDTRKIGIESCALTNNNWFLISSDNITRSQQDSLKPLLGGGSVQSYRLENRVGVSIDFTYASDSAVSKTTNLPITSAPPQNNVVNFGIKTTDSNENTLRIWGLVFIAQEGDASWN